MPQYPNELLSTELVAARLSGEKVLIIMHIPPGKNAYAVAHNRTPTQMWAQLPLPNNNWMHQFLTLMKQYQSEITGILYGHTHMDEVRRLYDVDGVNITEVLFPLQVFHLSTIIIRLQNLLVQL